jgi:hypothetical protein
MVMLKVIDLFFIVFHSILIVFNLIGWIWKKTRRWNLVTLIMTGGSWFILGIYFGWGYCFCTDWHWQVLGKMGETRLPGSYIQYIILRLFSVQIETGLADKLTLILYFIALLCSLCFNFFHRRIRAS